MDIDGIESRPSNSPATLPKTEQGKNFGVDNKKVDTRHDLKIYTEFPLRNGKNGKNIALFFKRFIMVLFVSNKKIQLLEWDKTNESPS